MAALGAAVYMRIVAKEKNRRQRYLLLRFAEQEKRLAEQEAASQAGASETEGGDKPAEAIPVVEAA